MAQISHLIRIKGSLDSVYNAVASNASIAKWFTESRSRAYKDGGDLRLIFPEEEVEFIVSRMQKNKVIVWHCISETNPWFNTDVAFEFRAEEDSTTVIFDHSNWPEVTDLFRDCSMSWAYFLESLKLFIERGVGTPESVAPACGATS